MPGGTQRRAQYEYGGVVRAVDPVLQGLLTHSPPSRSQISPLIHLFGWKHEHDAATGHVAIDSPDASLFVDFAPLHPLGRWLTVAHHEPYWEATFSRQAPLEAVAAVTQALPQLLGDARHADRIPITDMRLDQLAKLNDWSAEDGALTSPDLYCRLEHTPGEEVAWQFEHVCFEGAPLATFTQDTPECLVRTSSPTLPRPWRWSGSSPMSPSARGMGAPP